MVRLVGAGQIHNLECELNLKLFDRAHRAIHFTPEGERLFHAADSAMQHLQDAIGTLEASRLTHQPVNVTASISFVGLWLLPRLPNFQKKHPKVEVRLSASNEIFDLRREGLDIAIRYSAPEKLPENARILFGETIFPVAHPSLGISELDNPKTISNSVLLEFEGDNSPGWRWDSWLEAQGWQGVKPKGVLRFNLFDQMIHAAIAGQGIALGRKQFISPMLQDGRLMALPTKNLGPVSKKVFSLTQRDAKPSKDVKALIDWILEEASLTNDE